MKERRLHDKPACTVKAAPYPVEVLCPHCGYDVEIWSDESENSCDKCGSTIHNNIGIITN
jgi:ribosomal protein S27E